MVRQQAVTVEPQEIARAAREAGLGKLRLQFYDREFKALPGQVWDLYLKWSKIDEVKYVPESVDCDLFACALTAEAGLRMGVNGCAMVFDLSGGHCYSALLVKEPGQDLQVRIVEPQSDGTVVLGSTLSTTESYKAEDGFVMFL